MTISEEIRKELVEGKSVGKEMSADIKASHEALKKTLNGKVSVVRDAFQAKFGKGRLVMSIRTGYEGEWLLDGMFESKPVTKRTPLIPKKAGMGAGELAAVLPSFFNKLGFGYTHVETKGNAVSFEASI